MKRLFLIMMAFIWLFCATTVSANPFKNLFDQATQKYNQGDYQGAMALFEKTLEIHPQFAPSYNFLGLTHKSMGTNLREVTWLFEKAIEIDPSYAEAYNNLGKAYYELGEFDKAEETCLAAHKINPKHTGIQLSLGWIYLLGKSEPANAREYFEMVVESNQLPYAYFGLGIAYFMDQERFRTLEMITALRKLEENALANELETMMRQSSYTPPKFGGTPLILPERQAGTLVKDAPYTPSTSSSSKAKYNVPVRLSGKMEDVAKSAYKETNQLSGTQRIRALQQNYQKKGSGY